MPTLTYSPPVEGWPSFYSFEPDYMLGMNNYFYTWKNGDLYRHDDFPTYNYFYEQEFPSIITTVFNEAPLSNLLWKTIHLESQLAWDVTMSTDIQSGYIEYTWFEKKEAAYFGFVRNTNAVDPSRYALRSAVGLGIVSVVSAVTGTAFLQFDFPIDSMLYIGDIIYFAEPSGQGYSNPLLVGEVTEIGLIDDVLTVTVEIDVDNGGQAPSVGDFILYAKNTVAESSGVLGHYNVITLQNDSTIYHELFSVEAEVMASYPYP
jgi:hypothetical protein